MYRYLRQVLQSLLAIPDRSSKHDGRPFDPRTPFTPPSGRFRNWAHYGVMVPGLPEPYRAFGLMSIVGTPGVEVFANDWAIRTTPRDTAYVVSGTNSMPGDTFASYSVQSECELAPDGSVVRFGTVAWDWTVLTRSHPRYSLKRSVGHVTVELEISATPTVTWFIDIPRFYQHWSLMCDYTGTITDGTRTTQISGLANVEYASGSGPNALPEAVAKHLTVPAEFFTYQVINLDGDSQLLLTQILVAGGGTLRTAYLRDRRGSRRITTGIGYAMGEPTTRTTPDGREMSLPGVWGWHVDGHASIRATGAGDWRYGLGAGFVGSFDYTGEVAGRAVQGVGYVEHIDLR
jgi:hypothetical protein